MTSIRRVYIALLLGFAMVFAGLLLVMGLLLQELNSLRPDARDNFVWYAGRFDHERLMLIQALDGYIHKSSDTADFELVTDRYDIFFSRTQHSQEGPLGDQIAKLKNGNELLRRVGQTLKEIEPMLPAIERYEQAAYSQVRNQLERLGPDLRALSLDAMLQSVGETKKHQAALKHFMFLLVFLFAGLVLIGGALLVLLNTEKQRAQRMSEELDTRVKERTSELAAKNTQLERANEGLRQFAFVASHDLQEPLRKIKTFSSILSDELKGELSANASHAISVISNSSDRLRRLVTDLLEYSRVSNRALSVEATDLDRLVRDVIHDLSVQITEANAVINIASLPWLKADPLQMRQLFQNLLTNALKYRSPDRRCSITIDAQQEVGAELTISVRDNGLGFSSEHRNKIMEPFQRLHPGGLETGTGIGLAICSRIAQRHGWTLTAESEPNKGATFSLHIHNQGQFSPPPGSTARDVAA